MPAMEIPTIDVGPYLRDPDSPEAAEVVAAVRKACETVAFFSMVGHGIPKEVQQNVFAASKRLFDLPFEEKLRLKSPVMLSRGYDAMGQQVLEPGTLPDQKEVRWSFCQRHPARILNTDICGRASMLASNCQVATTRSRSGPHSSVPTSSRRIYLTH
jgi:isopenicillin N synthase-like dioxygenase